MKISMEELLLTLFRMGLFEAAHGWVRETKSPPPPPHLSKNLSHISDNDETWHSYTLPKEDSNNI